MAEVPRDVTARRYYPAVGSGFRESSALQLPDVFCWTKFGTESGEAVSSILRRKESERRACGGVFLWGIGNAVGPSIEQLIGSVHDPKVVFTPMISKPAARDVAPEGLAVWHRGLGLDGVAYSIPEHAMVTSRVGSTRRAHYALVCKRDDPIELEVAQPAATFTASTVSNLRSGSPVGSSQVTAVVRRDTGEDRGNGREYRIAFIAELVAPYLVTLTEHAVVQAQLR